MIPTRVKLADPVEPDLADVLRDVRIVPEERQGGLDGSVGVLVDYREYTGRSGTSNFFLGTFV